MNLFTSIFMLLGMVAQVKSLSEDQIDTMVRQMMASKSYLKGDTLDSSATYQSKAFQAVKNNLKNVAGKEQKHVRNYFAAACIFYATNGQYNQVLAREQGANVDVPSWTNTDEWIFNSDYCDWFGITCFLDILDPAVQIAQAEEENIIEIQLYNNTLYGNWPQEVGLLGEHLVTIDLYDNYYHSAFEYEWFADMDALNYLWFGSTSWDASGIPDELNLLTNLRQFDNSYTLWSEGPIRPSAFESLTQLSYVDMGSNIYEYDSEAAPSMEAFRDMDGLLRLYFENVRFVDASREDVVFSLDFLTDLEDLIEGWFDFTKFQGGLPDLPAALKSLSLVQCGLRGNLNKLANTDASLDRIWLSGNKFSGGISSLIATKHENATIFHFEENNLEGTLPQAFCDMLVTNGGTLETLGANANNCNGPNCCTCIGAACDQTEDPTPAPTVPGPPPGFICFSGSSTVEVENVGEVKMEDLTIGDSVRVSNNKFEPIYSFGHKSSSSTSEYLRISTEGSAAALEISPDHMVAMEGGRHVPASLVKKGDMLLTVTDELAAVTSIKNVVRKGAFAPFTASGNIVVNGIVASNYVAYQGSEYVKIGEMETPFSYQFMGHTFNSVHRLAVMVGITGETYTPEGISNWVATAHSMTTYVAGQNVLVILGLALLLPLLMLARLIEMLVCSPTAMAVVVGGLGLMNYKRSAKKTV
mmetsp:Transcript_21620/g.32740  ORF Transcript_21620/g.32740 Transcript_21620/m.32740 type:complete len:698 (+) Transcript_21620:73-2166(+)